MGVRNLEIPSGGKIKVDAWRHASSYNPAVSIEAGVNSDPVEVRVQAFKHDIRYM